MNPSTSKVQNLTIPLHLCSNEEINEIIKDASKKEREWKKGKMVDKKSTITPKKFLNSQLANKTCL